MLLKKWPDMMRNGQNGENLVLLSEFDENVMRVYFDFQFPVKVPFTHHLAMRKWWKCQSQGRWITVGLHVIDILITFIWWNYEKTTASRKPHKKGIFSSQVIEKTKFWSFWQFLIIFCYFLIEKSPCDRVQGIILKTSHFLVSFFDRFLSIVFYVISV